MPTAIAVTGPGLVLPPQDQQTPPPAVVLRAPPGEQSLDQALGDMQLLLERHGHVIAVYPSGIAPAHERRLHTVRAVLESDRIA